MTRPAGARGGDFGMGLAALRKAVARLEGQNKYSAHRCPCEQGGEPHWHGSEAERRRCFVLTQRERLGEISHLRRHTSWPLLVNGQRVGVYTDDFDFIDHTGAFVVEDVKSPATRRETAYRLRKRLLAACLGITISEVEG